MGQTKNKKKNNNNNKKNPKPERALAYDGCRIDLKHPKSVANRIWIYRPNNKNTPTLLYAIADNACQRTDPPKNRSIRTTDWCNGIVKMMESATLEYTRGIPYRRISTRQNEFAMMSYDMFVSGMNCSRLLRWEVPYDRLSGSKSGRVCILGYICYDSLLTLF